MRDQNAIADTVAAAINPAEISADAAALDAARTLVVLLEARQSLGLPMSAGLPALDRVAKAAVLAVGLRGELVRAHRMLDRVGRDIGVKMEDFGKDVPPMGDTRRPAPRANAHA